MTPFAGIRTMRQSLSRSLPRCLLLVTAALALSACADKTGVVEPDVDGLVIREVILSADDGSVTYSHIDHWHGAPVVEEGGTRVITLHFTSLRGAADDHNAPPSESWFTLASASADYSVRTVIEDTTVARWSGDRVSGTLEGLREGASRMSFVVQRGGTTVYEAPPLNFRVQPAP